MGSGGGAEKVPMPEPPKPPTMKEQMESWAEGYPTVAKAQLEQLPKFGRAAIDIARELYPTTSGLQENIAGQAVRGMESGLSDIEEDYYRDQFASGLGTNAGSPMGSDYMSRNMLMARQGREDYWRNVGSTMAGRQQLTQAPTIGDFGGGFTPGNALNYGSNIYGSQASIFGAQAGMFNTAQQARQSGANAMTSGLFGLGSSIFGAAGTALGG